MGLGEDWVGSAGLDSDLGGVRRCIGWASLRQSFVNKQA